MTTKKEHIFTCKPCQYSTSSSSNFRRHMSTSKHAKNATEDDSKEPPPKVYTCMCGNSYSHRGSLYNHQLNCMNRTAQFSTVLKITNDCCDALQCCDEDKEIIRGLVSKYVSDTKRHVSSQLRGYLKQRDKISDPEMRKTMNEFYQTNISVENATEYLISAIRATESS